MRLGLCDSVNMKPPIEFRSPRTLAAPIKVPAAPKAKAPATAKSATPKPAKAKGGKKAAKAKPPASTAAKPPRPSTASIAPDIPALKARFLGGSMVNKDWEDIAAILDAAQARREKNKLKQRNWRDGKK